MPLTQDYPPRGVSIHVYVVDFAGVVLASLGLYGKLADNPGALFPFLADKTNILACLGAGIALMFYAIWQFFSHFRKVRKEDPLFRQR